MLTTRGFFGRRGVPALPRTAAMMPSESCSVYWLARQKWVANTVVLSRRVSAGLIRGTRGGGMIQQALSSFIWSVADLLRGDYKQADCGGGPSPCYSSARPTEPRFHGVGSPARADQPKAIKRMNPMRFSFTALATLVVLVAACPPSLAAASCGGDFGGWLAAFKLLSRRSPGGGAWRTPDHRLAGAVSVRAWFSGQLLERQKACENLSDRVDFSLWTPQLRTLS